jgi:hypothetical protein
MQAIDLGSPRKTVDHRQGDYRKRDRKGIAATASRSSGMRRVPSRHHEKKGSLARRDRNHAGIRFDLRKCNIVGGTMALPA